MDLSTASEILKGAVAISGMITTYLTLRREREKVGKLFKEEQLTRHEAEQIVIAGQISAQNEPDEKEIGLLQALPKDLGAVTKDKVDKILKRYYKAISSPISIFELDRETEIAESEMCHTLKLIMRHNQGRLPTKHLRDLWDSFNCQNTND